MNNLIELLELKNWWFNNSIKWFNSTTSDDIEITNKYKNLIHNDYELNSLLENKDTSIAFIILHDQIIRHMSRVQLKHIDSIERKIKQHEFIEFVKLFYSKYKNELEGYYFCFALLPLRHTKIFEEEQFVIMETWNKLENTTDEKMIKIYKNYLKITYKNATNKNIYIETTKLKYNKITEFIQNHKEILDTKCFLEDLDNLNQSDQPDDIITKIIKTCKKINKKTKYVLSISGGVDSMVLSYILTKLNVEFVMLHINYANRDTCLDEKTFLSTWANFIGVELYIRDIYEINRTKCMNYELRNLYENYTKCVRYQSYIDIIKIKGWDLIEWSILLGHNNDDCIENILTNIANKTKYENLFGMTFETTIQHNSNLIYFTRPLLTISKHDIYHYANHYKIPYLIDSTPKWSQRGMIRDIVKPALIQWNTQIIEGLEKLNDRMKESLELVDLLVSTWINNLIPLKNLNNDEKIHINVPTKLTIAIYEPKHGALKINITEITENKIFWSRLFDKLNIKTSSRSLNSALLILKSIKTKFANLQKKQIKYIQINSNTYLYCWKVDNNNIIIAFD